MNHSISYVERLLQAYSWPVVRCHVYCNLCCSIKQCVSLLAEHWSIGTVPTGTFFFVMEWQGWIAFVMRQMQTLSIVYTFRRKKSCPWEQCFNAIWFRAQLCSIVDKYTYTMSLDFKGVVTPNFCAVIEVFVNITKAVQWSHTTQQIGKWMERIHQVRFQHVQYWCHEFKPWNFEVYNNAELEKPPYSSSH